ncbi:undecaprenyl-diphosphatase UppP [Patescibacteria group bacterium]|nr:undecaprenyl-diphosphatase UppP [Patescibacteria group bacterium]MBU1868468.1 undecaprenyl-diphosphatase UppP [Patescibacteria group bacterium]
MPLINTIILSLTQGITEFLPISSTGHLILITSVLPNIEPDLFLDTMLHLGTLIAILIYFSSRWIKLISSMKLLTNILLCTIPAAIVGIIAKNQIETALRNPPTVAVSLILGAALLWLADRKSDQNTSSLSNLSLKQALLIGAFQATALIPGASRAGMTIAGGLLLGLKRKEAAEFSFLAAIPVIAGAGIFEITESINAQIVIDWPQTILGLTLSSIFGLICIKWFIKYLQKEDFKPFVWYRVVLGIVILLTFL